MTERTLGDRIREERQKSNLTAAELGRRAGLQLGRKRPISASAVRNQENGTNGVPLEVLRAYADILGTSLTYLAVGVDDEGRKDEKIRQDQGEVLDFEDLAIEGGYEVTGHFSEPLWRTDDIFGDTHMFIHMPGWEDVQLYYHIVSDDSLAPIYPKGTRLITTSVWDAQVNAGDHVIAWQSSAAPSLMAVKTIVKVDERVELHHLIDNGPPPVILYPSHPDQPVHFYLDQVVLATFRVLPYERRPRLFIEDSWILNTYEDHLKDRAERAELRGKPQVETPKEP